MRPFIVPPNCECLTLQYPPAELFVAALKSLRPLDLEGVLRLCFSEGIPFAFRQAPLVYEAARQWMATRLQVHPKQLTIIGSARIGYSVCPPPKYGKAFGDDSDLDFSVVCESLFSRVVDEFNCWESDYETGRVMPRGPQEQINWNDHVQKVPENISRGFVDPYKIPTFNAYPLTQRIQQTLFMLQERLRITPGAPHVRHASIRVYRDWDSFFRQLSLNMNYTLNSVRSHIKVQSELLSKPVLTPALAD